MIELSRTRSPCAKRQRLLPTKIPSTRLFAQSVLGPLLARSAARKADATMRAQFGRWLAG